MLYSFPVSWRGLRLWVQQPLWLLRYSLVVLLLLLPLQHPNPQLLAVLQVLAVLRLCAASEEPHLVPALRLLELLLLALVLLALLLLLHLQPVVLYPLALPDSHGRLVSLFAAPVAMVVVVRKMKLHPVVATFAADTEARQVVGSRFYVQALQRARKAVLCSGQF